MSSSYEVLSEGLRFPEGPLVLPDGGLLVSEILGAAVTRIHPDGKREQIAEVPGGPNGLAFGPDGALYVANMGGFPEQAAAGLGNAHPLALGYRGGSIQRVDIADGSVTEICTQLDDGEALRAPDDLIFDAHGGFYFTDLGRVDLSGRSMDVTGIYYATPDGGPARRAAPSQFATNGIGISPDGGRLWWTEYYSGRLLARDILGPGRLADPGRRHGDCLYVHPVPVTYFDSLTVLADGGVAVAVHDGTPTGKSGVMSFNADGTPTAFEAFDDPFTTHIAFGGHGMRTAYVTLSASGRIAELAWPTSGLPPPYSPPATISGAFRGGTR